MVAVNSSVEGTVHFLNLKFPNSPYKGSPDDVRGPIRGVSLSKSLHHGEVKHLGSALVFLAEILRKPSNNLEKSFLENTVHIA